MSQDTFNLNKLVRMFSTTGDETLSIGTYAQTGTLVVFSKKSSGNKPIAKLTLDSVTVTYIVKYLEELITASPDTRNTLVQQKYNRDQKSYEPSTTFTFYKDESNLIGIEIGSNVITPPIKFQLRGSNNIALSTSSIPDAEKSVIRTKELIKILLDDLPMAKLLSTYNMPNMSSKNNQNGGRNNYGSENSNRNRDNNMF